MDSITRKKFKRRIAKVKARVDNTPPKFNVNTYYQIANLHKDERRIKDMDKQNIALLRRMNIINRLGDYVDCWLPEVKYKSKYEDQQLTNTDIMKKNKALLKSIRNASSQYRASELIKSWRTMKMKAMRSRRKIFIS